MKKHKVIEEDKSEKVYELQFHCHGWRDLRKTFIKGLSIDEIEKRFYNHKDLIICKSSNETNIKWLRIKKGLIVGIKDKSGFITLDEGICVAENFFDVAHLHDDHISNCVEPLEDKIEEDYSNTIIEIKSFQDEKAYIKGLSLDDFMDKYGNCYNILSARITDETNIRFYKMKNRVLFGTKNSKKARLIITLDKGLMVTPNIGRVFDFISDVGPYLEDIKEDKFELEQRVKLSSLFYNACDKLIKNGNIHGDHFIDSLVYIPNNVKIDIDLNNYQTYGEKLISGSLACIKYGGFNFYLREREYKILFSEEEEKNWEILEFRSTKPFDYFRFIKVSSSEDRFEPLNPNILPNNEQFFLHSEHHIISKVKRLSDGEIFEIGDTVNIKGRDAGKILGFKIGHRSNIFGNNLVVISEYSESKIEAISKTEQPTSKTKDWEVLEVEKGPLGRCFLDGDSFWHGGHRFTYDQMIGYINQGLWGIYRVKRLSDGEIFTLGENVHSSIIQSCSQSDEIKEFFISKNEMNVHFGHFSTPLRAIIKIKQPTLKTEDGKELCDGQVYYYLDINNIDDIIMQGTFISKFPRYSNNYKIFSSKEKAEQYIKENKPQFNKKDMIEFAEYFSDNYNHADCEPTYPLAKWLRKRKK